MTKYFDQTPRFLLISNSTLKEKIVYGADKLEGKT